MRIIRLFPLHWLPLPKKWAQETGFISFRYFHSFQCICLFMCVHSEGVHACRCQRSNSVLGTWEMSFFIKTTLLTGLEHATNARMLSQPALRIHLSAATGLGIRYRSQQACFIFSNIDSGDQTQTLVLALQTLYLLSPAPFPWFWSPLTRRWGGFPSGA